MGFSFLKEGADAHTDLAKADLETEQKKAAAEASADKSWRFYLKDNEEARITFLDGDLTEEGLLNTVSWREHQKKIGNNWRNWFPCVAEDEPCPLCDERAPSWVAAFTVIDHRSFESKKEPGTFHTNQKRLFVCKRDTFRRLQKRAATRDGLAGCTFDVSRIGDKAENVGSDFEFIEKQSVEEIAAKYELEAETLAPLDYKEEITLYTASEIRALVGVPEGGVVGEADVKAQLSDSEIDDQL